jgi:hypothetical protein
LLLNIVAVSDDNPDPLVIIIDDLPLIFRIRSISRAAASFTAAVSSVGAAATAGGGAE